MGLPAIRGALKPLQEELLKQVAARASTPEAILKELHISPARLGTWICDPAFRAAWLVAIDGYERMHEPAFWAHVRLMAQDVERKDAYKWAELYARRMERPAPIELPPEDDEVETGNTRKPGSLKLDEEDFEDLVI